MKKRILVAVVVLAAFALGQQGSKLWVTIQYQYRSDRVLFIEDRETGTRCYAITNDAVNPSGYAISCVKR